MKRLRRKHHGYLLLALDRTQWKGRNLIVVSLIWDKHALAVNWEFLDKKGSSNFAEQRTVLKPVLKLLQSYPVLVLGDREFHSVKLAEFLSSRKVGFCLRQKKNKNFSQDAQNYQSLEDLGFKPGMSKFFKAVYINKNDPLGPFNLATYWKRKYRRKGPNEPWYILTSCQDLKTTLRFYRARWGIETMFKDCKTGGYNLEDTKVNDTRFLALFLLIVMAYSLATCQGSCFRKVRLEVYVVRLQEDSRKERRHSDFWLGLYGYVWACAMEIWSEVALKLTALKPHKRLYFQRGFKALSLIQSSF